MHYPFAMGCLQSVGSIKLQVSFGKEPYKRDNILHKRPKILSILLTVATSYFLRKSVRTCARMRSCDREGECVWERARTCVHERAREKDKERMRNCTRVRRSGAGATYCNTLQHISIPAYCIVDATHINSHARASLLPLREKILVSLPNPKSPLFFDFDFILWHALSSVIHQNEAWLKWWTSLNHELYRTSWTSHALHCNTMQHTAIHCNALQHTATHCDTLQYAAIHCNMQQPTDELSLDP